MPLNPLFPISNGASHGEIPGNLSHSNKPSLTKVSAIDVQDEEGEVYHQLVSFNISLTVKTFSAAKKLSRGISRTAENDGVISQIRNELSASLAEVDESSGSSTQLQTAHALETNDCTFSLPDLSNQSGNFDLNFEPSELTTVGSSIPDEFRAFLENELIDTSMNISLQEAARLNWWTCLGEGCERLWPLSTTGDGNCLLHAASLGKAKVEKDENLLRLSFFFYFSLQGCGGSTTGS